MIDFTILQWNLIIKRSYAVVKVQLVPSTVQIFLRGYVSLCVHTPSILNAKNLTHFLGTFPLESGRDCRCFHIIAPNSSS